MLLKTIRLDGAMRALVMGFCALFVIGGLFGAATALWPPPGWHRYDPTGAAVICGFCLAVAGAMALMGWMGLRASTEIHEDQIVYFNGLRIRIVRRADICGYRIVEATGLVRLFVRGGKPIALPGSALSDPCMEAWFDGIPDLDEQDSAQAEHALQTDPSWGTDVESRHRLIARLRLVARVVYWTAIAVCAWLWLRPQPYLWAVAAACALLPAAILIQLLSGRRFSLAVDTVKTDARPSLGAPLFFAGAALAIRTFMDFNFLDWQTLLAASLAGGLILTAALAVLDGKLIEKWGILTAVFFACAAYSYGAFAQGNVWLDGAATQKFPAIVRSKDVDHGKITRYELKLAPWGPIKEESTVDVTRGRYDATKAGGKVCVFLNPGRFGVRWYDVGDC